MAKAPTALAGPRGARSPSRPGRTRASTAFGERAPRDSARAASEPGRQTPKAWSRLHPVRLGLRVIEAHQALALIDERGLVALRDPLERQELEDGLLRRARDLPPARDEAIDEERRPYLRGEDHLLLVFRRQDARSLRGIATEDRGVEARKKSRWRDGVARRARGLREVEQLAAALVAEAEYIRDALERSPERRHTASGPVREIADGGGPERAEIPASHEIECGVGRRCLAHPRGWRDEAGELPVLPVRAALLPDDPARCDRREEIPVAKAFVLRRVARDELADLLARPRLRREREHFVVDVLEGGEIGPAGWSPRGEAPVERSERIGGVLLRAHEVERCAHQRRLDHEALVDRAGQVVALECREPRPQCDVR